MYIVKIWIIGEYKHGNDVEEIDIASPCSLRSAKNRATRWIRRSFCDLDLEGIEIQKEQITRCSKRANWTLRFSADAR